MMNLAYIKLLSKEQYAGFLKTDLGVQREILSQIDQKHFSNDLAVVISGLRRVGKSTLLAQIANKYFHDDYYYVNFDDDRFLDFTAGDFQRFHEILIELFGVRKVFFFDEIQNIENWESFARRLIDQGYKLFITGSNSELISGVLGSKLTGRYSSIKLLPFSFREYLQYRHIDYQKLLNDPVWKTEEKGLMSAEFDLYMKEGGIPGVLKNGKEFCMDLYSDLLYRDVVAKHEIKNIKELKELSLFLLSNTAKYYSYNRLRGQLGLGSISTVKNFIEYLENCWLLFSVDDFNFSLKQKHKPTASKKIYAIDTGLVDAIAFKSTFDSGFMLENIIFLELVRRGKEVHVYKSKNGLEVDFYLRHENILIQVCEDFEGADTVLRETRALSEAMSELKVKKALIISRNEEKHVVINGTKIEVVPVYKWLFS